jgi:hypothetical protein
MAHFAQLGSDGKTVVNIHAVNNNVVGEPNITFPETEPIGQDFLKSLGLSGIWVQCSYNGSFRGCYPGQGYTYDAEADVFVAPQATVIEEAP